MKIAIFGATAAAALLGCAAVWAQAAPPAAAERPEGRGEGLEEIIVTAQRRSENLQDVPIAVTAVSGEALRSSGVGSNIDLGLVTPGLTYGVFSGYVLPHIRGIGTTADGIGLENSVATYVDGVYLASMPASLMSLIDVSQIEVLKGPQGTLFGRNATGGLVQIITKDPSPRLQGEGSVSYGNFQTGAADLYVSGPVASTLAADLTAHVSHQGQGFGRNFADGAEVYKIEHDVAVRSKWLWTPTDATSARLSFDYEEKLGDDSSIYRPVPGAASALRGLLAGAAEPPLGPYDTDTFLSPFNNLKSGGMSVRLTQDLGFATLQNTAAYRRSFYETRFDPVTTPIPVEAFDLKQTDNQISEEVSLSSKSGHRLQWVAGLYYLRAASGQPAATLDFHGPVVNPRFPLGQILFNSDQRTDAYAAYAQSTLPITDADHLTLGARYSQERHALDNASQQGFLVGGIPLGYLQAPYSQAFTNRRPTWRAAFDHQFSPDVMAYASFNSGFKSGGFNTSATVPPFKPEELYAYETGLKLDLLDHRLRINTAAYYYDYKDNQVQFFNQSRIAYYNANGAKLYGLDSDLQALVSPGFTLTAGLAVLKSYFSSFPNAVTYTSVPVLGATGPSYLTTGSASGHRLPLAPALTVNIGANYRHELARGVGSVNLTYQHSSNYAFTPDNAFQQPPFDALNASLSWSTYDERSTATLWGRNLTDDLVANFITETALVMLSEYRAPRTYGITLSTKF